MSSTKYTGNWDGLTGQAVANIIQGGLNSHEDSLSAHATKINESVKDISFNVNEETSTVTSTITKSDGTTSTKSFTLKPVSTNTGTLTLINYESLSTGNTIVKLGDNYTFEYEYEIKNSSGTKLRNIQGKIYVTVKDSKGTSITYEKGDTVLTALGSNRIGTITLNANEIPEGTNEITVNVISTVSGSTVYLDTTPVFKLNVLYPVLKVTFDEGDGINKMRTESDKFNMYFTATNSKGGAISVNGSAVSITKKIYYNTIQSYSTNETSANLSYDDIRGDNTIQNGRQRIFIQGEITAGGVTVKTNIIMLYMMCNNAATQNYVWYSMQLNDVKYITSGDPTIDVTQYDTVEFETYAYSTVATNLKYKLIQSGNETDITTVALDAETLTDISYSYIFKSNASGQTFKIVDTNNNSASIALNVKSIGSSLGELTSQVISLSASGKSQTDHTWKYGNIEVDFDGNFDWSGNGWVNNGLLINNGATATINYAPFTTGVFTASFKINASNSIANEKLIYCGTGNTNFAIYPEKAVFQINGSGISTEFDSESTHEITFVRYSSSYGNLISIFIDGQAQQSKCIADSATGMTSSIIMTSASTQLYVYNINVFSQALSFTNVQALYCFNQTNSTDIVNYIKSNNVFPSGALTTSIGNHSQDITIDSLPVGSRYLLISAYVDSKTGTALDPTPWKTMDEYPGSEAERYKGIGHLVGNIKFIEKTADGSASDRNFCVDKGTLCPQGTSSMAYPLKNWRLRFQKPIDSSCEYYNTSGNVTKWGDDACAGDFGFSTIIYTGVSPDFKIKLEGTSHTDYACSVLKGTSKKSSTSIKYPLFSTSWGDTYTGADAKIFCLKADYAESSGSHNTGFARMVHDALTNSDNICPNIERNSKLPQQYVVDSLGTSAVYTKQIRSTIDGFPIYLFFEKADGTVIYHGKYNFNNEKSSKDVFGFEKIHDYFDNVIVKDESKVLKRLFNDSMGYYDATHFAYAIVGGKYNTDEDTLPYINPTECWEFSNNTFDVEPSAQNSIGAFQYPYTIDSNGNALSSYPKASQYPNRNPFTVKDSSGNLAWLSEAWEYRYPGLDDGSEGDTLYKNGICRPFLLDSLYRWLYKHNGNLINFDNSTINDFAENLHKYFNVNYLLKYFVLTKWFGNVDQRIKNCMLSFYCDPFVTSNEDSECPMGHMRGFFIFYDNDTILGVDNAGTLTQDWNIDEDVYPGHGKHAIWDNLEYCYNYYVSGATEYSEIRNMGAMIESAYQALRKVITDAKLKKYFETDQCDKFPDAIHNLDAELKYYYVGELNDTITNFNSSAIAKFQGNRRFHRKRWLTRRTNWLDAKFKAGNYNDYSYKFKVGGTAGQYQEGGTIVLRSAIKNWRFHIFNTTGQNLASSSLLQEGDTASLVIKENSFSISDFVSIAALYGCSEINLNNFVVSTWFQNLESGGKQLPYLKKFVLNEANNTQKPKVFSSSAFETLLTINNSDGTSNALFPNLEELIICNTQISTDASEASTRFSTLDLSSFSKLSKINATGTDIDIKLPNSSLLTQLIIQSPQELEIKNKPNLNSLNIINIANLNKLIIGPGNSTSLYTTLFNILNSKITTAGFTANVTLGTRDNYYSIPNEQVTTLVNLAKNKYTNLTVTGYIYNSNISSEDLDTLTSQFKQLVVSTSVTTNLEFKLSSTTLREGESITINLTSGLLDSPDDWNWEIYDKATSTWIASNSLGGLITEDSENKTRTKLILKAGNSGSNNTETYRLRVSANYNNDVVMCNTEIPIQYIGITDITLDSEKKILSEGMRTSIILNCTPRTHTKSVWLNTSSNVYWNTSNCSVSLTGSPELIMDSSKQDASAYMTIGGIISSILNIIYDKTLCTYTEAKTESDNNDKYWIYKLLYDRYGTGASTKDPVRVSTLNQITLNNNDISSLLQYSYNNGEGTSTIVPQDLTYLQYCQFNDIQFTIPGSLQFTDMVIPYNKFLTQVNWNLTIDSYGGYGNVVFPASLETANISISSETIKLTQLCLDFSKTKITKIYNGNGSCDNMAASVKFLYNTSLAQNATNIEVIKYPSTLVTFGNYVKNTNWTNTYAAIFNLNGISAENTTEYAPLYILSECSTVRKLGPIYGYRVSNSFSGFPWTSSNFTHLYHSFTQGSNLPNGATDNQDFSAAVHIGNETFKDASIQNLVINRNVTNVGDQAFMNFTGTIKSSETNSVRPTAQLFDKLEVIGDYAFATLSKEHIFEFSKLTKIGEYAFARKDGDTFTHTIYINQTTSFLYTATSFGSGNIVYMPQSLQTELSKSVNLWTNLNSNVTIQTL